MTTTLKEMTVEEVQRENDAMKDEIAQLKHEMQQLKVSQWSRIKITLTYISYTI